MPDSSRSSTVAGNAAGTLDILVIGAGFAGLYAVHAARQAGHDVLCLEAGSGVGGTWFFNRYPGARCDVESIDYSYSFDEDLQNDWKWSERYATQPEILSYINHVAERFDLLRSIRLETRVVAADWDESAAVWRVATDAGEVHVARHVLCAAGSLSVPNKPPIPGVDDFAGEVLFTSQWPEPAPDLAGKRVGIVGTGSSGIQSIPVIAQEAEELTVFQRTPNFSVPALNRPLTEEDQRRIREEYPERRRKSRVSGGGSPYVAHPKSAEECDPDERTAALEKGWTTGGVLFGKTFPDQYTNIVSNDYARDFAVAKIRAIVEDPEVADDLIPSDHPIGTKRICTDSGYYATFNRDNVALVNLRKDPIEHIADWGVKTSESSYELDVLVFATGFDAMTGALTRMDIRGEGGVLLRDAWADGPVTYLGYQVPAFPNFFILNGPGSPAVLANMVLGSEMQVDWLLALIRAADEQGADRVAVSPDVAQEWTTQLQEAAEQTLFPRANSWYMGANIEGKPRKFMLYLGGLGTYAAFCDEIAADDYRGFELTAASAAAERTEQVVR
ncbi:MULTISPECIES: flavin-containing monooxygenase [unclassified Nocardioides]|uniref:flavin-containing monooxygenase n=1 Tax=unclassified Nocardioides TaxID=2615069 RepID=UPI000700DCDA|nr:MULTISPECIES: NAD(P)/FAD-dependent oxidoreductase [unclassified Nocardioides]KQY54338.1 cyclohexanone monooxygenase [Nocardioides sp. Root140]KRF10493.1 cyclohexanone monooxygenase [Nocardioides sp. Soil796]